MPTTLRLSALQMLVTSDVAENERNLLAGLARAAGDEADFLLTPEGSLSGYHSDFDGEVVAAAVERVAAAAKAAGVGLALGTCYKERAGWPGCHPERLAARRGELCEGSTPAEPTGERRFPSSDDPLPPGNSATPTEVCYNQVRVYTPEGEYLGYHAKILRCSSLDHPGTGEMQQFAEGTLRTFDWRGLRFGVLICNDLWATPGFTTMPNPYFAWRLKQMGAQFILHAINSGRDLRHRPWHEACTAMWAKAVQLPILQVNAAPADGEPLNAPSGVIGPDGERLISVSDCGEEYFVCQLTVGQELASCHP